MFDWMLSVVACPECKCPLKPIKLVRRRGKVYGGAVLCGKCQRTYSIVSGIPVLLPGEGKYTPWCFPMQEVVSDPESFATRRPKERPPMYEVVTYFGKETILDAILNRKKLPPKRQEKSLDFDGTVSPRERRRAYKVTQKSFVSSMTKTMKWKWDRNPLFNELVARAAEQSPTTILDFGTGPGGLLYSLLSERIGSRIIGLEYSFCNARMTQAAIEHLGCSSRAGMVEADARWMPFPTSSFDSVTALYGSYHIPKYSSALKEAYRVLKEGGWYFEVFYSKYPTFTKGLLTDKEEQLVLKHVQLPTDMDEVQCVCARAGFKKIEKITTGDSFLIKAQKQERWRSDKA